MLDRLSESFDAQRRFVANASHELRSPLTVIRSEAEVALANPQPDIDELRGMAESVVQASRRTEALLASLLILARSQRGLLHSEPVDLASVVGEAADAACAHGGRRRACGSTPCSSRSWSRATPRCSSGSSANLIENGVRYNRPGRLRAAADARGRRHGRARVENSGPPVEPAAAARLAEPFERLARDADGRGAGLGLSIVRAVSEAHGGTLAIEPRAEGGLRRDGAAAARRRYSRRW